tara:strand:+ start:217 stop:678 length:462 start_codon:yes stop_codon:yes gene_type:complete
LSPDLKTAGELTQEIADRFLALGRYAKSTDADAILFTCSAFGPAIEAVAADLSPLLVLKPNEAMLEEAIGLRNRIGKLATFQPSVPPMEAEFENVAGDRAVFWTICVEAGMDALLDGDAEKHNRLIAEAASDLSDYDAVMLADFSIAKAQPAV